MLREAEEEAVEVREEVVVEGEEVEEDDNSSYLYIYNNNYIKNTFYLQKLTFFFLSVIKYKINLL